MKPELSYSEILMFIEEYEALVKELETVIKVTRQEGESVQDCVARGVELLMKEGYDQDQAVAMAHSMCEQGKNCCDDCSKA